MVFELVTGDLLFDPRSGKDYDRCAVSSASHLRLGHDIAACARCLSFGHMHTSTISLSNRVVCTLQMAWCVTRADWFFYDIRIHPSVHGLLYQKHGGAVGQQGQ